MRPDAVIVATGATPLMSRIAGIECVEAITAWDVLRGHKLVIGFC